MMEGFLKNRLSKIDYQITQDTQPTNKKLLFHQSCQTQVDTATFQRVLHTYNNWVQSRFSIRNAFTQTEGIHIEAFDRSPRGGRGGDQAHIRGKQWRKGGIDFGAHVTEEIIQYELALLKTQEKNMKLLYFGSNSKSPNRKKKQKQ